MQNTKREAKQQLVLVSNLSAEKEALAKDEVRLTEQIANMRSDITREQNLSSNLQALLLSRDSALSELKDHSSEVVKWRKISWLSLTVTKELRSLRAEVESLKLKLDRQEAEFKENIMSVQLKVPFSPCCLKNFMPLLL